MIKNIFVFSISFLAACSIHPLTELVQPSPSAPVISQISTPIASPRPTQSSIATLSFKPTATSQPPAAKFVPTPGPALTLIFLYNGEIYRYSFQTWSSELVEVTDARQIEYAKISENHKVIAYYDLEGLKYAFSNNFAKSFLVSTEEHMDDGDFLLNSDGSLLAFSDELGLKLVDTETSEITILLEHNWSGFNTEPMDFDEMQVYSPLMWSSNSKWLVVYERYFEGWRTKVLSIVSNRLFPTSECHSEFSWSPDRRLFAMSVSATGYTGCGGRDGIYLVSMDETYTENRIYKESLGRGAGDRGISSVAWSPTGEWIGFNQHVYDPTANVNLSKVIIISPYTGGIRYEAIIENALPESLIWSPDGNYLYYVQHYRKEGRSEIFSISNESFEINMIYESQRLECVFAISPDGDWLIFGDGREGFRPPCHGGINLRAVHIGSGLEVSIQKGVQMPLLGWTGIE